jgi:hypothetical protein
MISPIAFFEGLVQERGLPSELTVIVPEYDQVTGRFREPRFAEACAAIAQGALRLLIVTVFERSYLADRQLAFSEILDQSFTRVVELPVTESELRIAFETTHALPAASSEIRAHFKKCYIRGWLVGFEKDISHKLKSPRASLGCLLGSSEPDARPQVGDATKASLRRVLEGLEQYRRDIEPIDLAITGLLGKARDILEAALNDKDARETAGRLAGVDRIFSALRKEIISIGANG